MITIIHGPMASGKTFHSDTFRRHYQCHAAVDLDSRWELQHLQLGGLLVLTTLSPDEAERCIRKVDRDNDIRIIDIRTARLAIGVAPEAPPLPARRAKT